MTAPADPQLAALAELVGQVAKLLQAGDDPAARSEAATGVAQLQAAVAQVGGRGATPGFDLAQIGEALAAFAAWLRAPTPDGEARAERAMSELQATLGPRVGWDPTREDAERRARYRREARAALDQIFADKPEPEHE
ncbi:MAG TPA: hypothetical protein VHW23_27870 [Kofleriaceae bacterium]|jgi:hypothetical protein|nr:hypothetical protein [Kofleriaceae bacterium]